MSLTDLMLAAILPAAVLLSAFCAASETALFSLSPSDRSRLRRISPEAAATIGRLMVRPRMVLLSLLLLTNLANVAYFVVGSVLERRVESDALTLAINVGMLGALILGADLLPKLLARPRRVAFCRVTAPALAGLTRVAGPVCRVLELAVVEPVLRLILPARRPEERALSPEELGALLDLSARAGEIAPDEQRLLGEIVALGSTRVREVMTPRTSMVWLEDSATPARVREVAAESGRTRIPVFKGSLDGGPVGILDVRRYFVAEAAAGGRGPARLTGLLEPPTFVPETARLDQLLDVLRSRGQERALCVDEFGAVVGTVGIDEVMARLVAAGSDEAAAAAAGVVRVSPNQWVVPGRLPARELAEYFFGPAGVRALGSRVSTVAGLVYARLGRVPEVGDSVRLGNVVLTVEAMQGRAVERIAVSVAPVEARA